MELSGSTQQGATRPVTGPSLWRSPVSDPQDPVAEIRGGSFAANRAWAEAGVPATTGAKRGAILQSTYGSDDAVYYTRMVYSDDDVQLRPVAEYDGQFCTFHVYYCYAVTQVHSAFVISAIGTKTVCHVWWKLSG